MRRRTYQLSSTMETICSLARVVLSSSYAASSNDLYRAINMYVVTCVCLGEILHRRTPCSAPDAYAVCIRLKLPLLIFT